MIADKGAKKGATTHFAKIISWYSKTDARVKSFNIDSDDYDGSSEDCAKAVRHALVKLFGPENIDNISSRQMTNSGGGVTGTQFHREIDALNVTAMPESYLIEYFTLHYIQLNLSNAVKHVLGEGGIQKMVSANKMQCSCFMGCTTYRASMRGVSGPKYGRRMH